MNTRAWGLQRSTGVGITGVMRPAQVLGTELGSCAKAHLLSHPSSSSFAILKTALNWAFKAKIINCGFIISKEKKEQKQKGKKTGTTVTQKGWRTVRTNKQTDCTWNEALGQNTQEELTLQCWKWDVMLGNCQCCKAEGGKQAHVWDNKTEHVPMGNGGRPVRCFSSNWKMSALDKWTQTLSAKMAS